MLGDLNILLVAGAKARHSAARHAVIAENVANANTPGYRARDLEPFEAVYAQKSASADNAMNTEVAFREKTVDVFGAASPNGNTVSIEDQMFRAGEASRDHDIAMTIYSKAMAMLRAALGGRG